MSHEMIRLKLVTITRFLAVAILLQSCAAGTSATIHGGGSNMAQAQAQKYDGPKARLAVVKFIAASLSGSAAMFAEALHSLAFSKKLREGSFFRDESYRFFHDRNRYAMLRRYKDGATETFQGVIRSGIHDVLSAMYYVRTQPIEVGQEIVVDVNSGRNYPMVIRVLRRERIKVPAGEFDAFVVQPTLREEGIFIQKGKNLKIWLTADERKMPVQMQVEVFIGHISARLESYRF